MPWGIGGSGGLSGGIEATASLPTGAIPAWRTAMTDTQKLYNVGTEIPNDAAGDVAWPGSVIPGSLYTDASDGSDAGSYVITGYSSGNIIESGAWGKLIFGSGGHTRFLNMLLSLDIGADSPTWGWFQQPSFETSDTNGAQYYYNPTEWAALRSGGRAPDAAFTQTEEGDGTMNGWDRAYPFGYRDWIIPRQVNKHRSLGGTSGAYTPTGFRYTTLIPVPAADAGISGGALIHVQGGQAPFEYSNYPSLSNITLDEWYASDQFHSGTDHSQPYHVKVPIYYRNNGAGTWHYIGDMPYFIPYGYNSKLTCRGPNETKVYVLCSCGVGSPLNSGWAHFVINYSGGLASASVGEMVAPGGTAEFNQYARPAIVYRGGKTWAIAPTGYTRGNTEMLAVRNLTDGTNAMLTFASGVSSFCSADDDVQIAYDYTNDKAIIVWPSAPGGVKQINCVVMTIPADPTVAGDYTFSEFVCTVDAGVSTPLSNLTQTQGSKTMFHEDLGVFFVARDSSPMMAFRPY